MIKVENLTFSYPAGEDDVFENISFQIDTDWKLGLIGRNGRGKTTLLKLLMGQYEYRGKIISSVIFDYFPYEVPDKEKMTGDVLSEICPQAADWELNRELSALAVNGDVLTRPFSTLSGGEQTKVLLAALFLKEGNFLLIDEPTNHLDEKAREMVSAYLNRKKGFILVSHDRYFLDGCVDHILSINRSDIQVTSGNFSVWYENFMRQQSFEESENEKLSRQVADLQRAAGRSAGWSRKTEASKFGNGPVDRGYIGHKSAKLMKRVKAAENRQQRALEEKKGLLRNREQTEGLKIEPLPYFTDRLFSFTAAAPVFDGHEICRPVTFECRSGDRIALDGGNGSGKSSLLKLLAGQDIPHSGSVKIGSGLIVSYIPQDMSGLRGNLSAFARDAGIDESLFLMMLRKLGFPRLQFEKDMASYSAGQRKKVLLARSLCQRAHLYVWDEPLNYIDIASRIQIEDLIRSACPTLIFVEHDRAFREAAATKVVEVIRQNRPKEC
jgi:lincosamide and streptogramin A transport system ATP-binding/permease protein